MNVMLYWLSLRCPVGSLQYGQTGHIAAALSYMCDRLNYVEILTCEIVNMDFMLS